MPIFGHEDKNRLNYEANDKQTGVYCNFYENDWSWNYRGSQGKFSIVSDVNTKVANEINSS